MYKNYKLKIQFPKYKKKKLLQLQCYLNVEDMLLDPFKISRS